MHQVLCQYRPGYTLPLRAQATVALSIPMERGTFTRNSAYRTSVPIPDTGDCRMIMNLCSGGEYPSVCTDTITGIRSYCQHLFSAFHLPFICLSTGWGPIPLSIDTLYAYPGRRSTTFLGFFQLFLTFTRGGAAGGRQPNIPF